MLSQKRTFRDCGLYLDIKSGLFHECYLKSKRFVTVACALTHTGLPHIWRSKGLHAMRVCAGVHEVSRAHSYLLSLERVQNESRAITIITRKPRLIHFDPRIFSNGREMFEVMESRDFLN